MLVTLRNLLFLPFGYFMAKRQGDAGSFLPPKAQLKKVLLLGSLGMGMTQILLFTSYSYMPSGMSTVVHFVYPLFVFLASALFFKQRIDTKSMLCLGLCVCGLLCFFPKDGGSVSSLGLILALLSGLSYAFYIVYLGQGGFEGISPFRLQTLVSAVNVLMLLPFSLVTGDFTLKLTPWAYGLGLFVALFVGLAFVLFQQGVAAIGSQKASFLSTFEPVTGFLAGTLGLNEPLETMPLIGTMVILLSVGIFSLPEKSKVPLPVPANDSGNT